MFEKFLFSKFYPHRHIYLKIPGQKDVIFGLVKYRQILRSGRQAPVCTGPGSALCGCHGIISCKEAGNYCTGSACSQDNWLSSVCTGIGGC